MYRILITNSKIRPLICNLIGKLKAILLNPRNHQSYRNIKTLHNKIFRVVMVEVKLILPLINMKERMKYLVKKIGSLFNIS